MSDESSSAYLQEIAEQPDVVRRVLLEGRSSAEAAARAIASFSPSFALIAARGSSDNAARYGQYLLGAQHGLSVGLAVPSLFTLYDRPPRLDRALVVGISQSGQSPDVVAVLEGAARQGALTIAITNDVDSPLARTATHVLTQCAGEERAVAATKTYTSQLATLALLSAVLDGGEARWAELSTVPETLERVLAACDDRARLASALAGIDRFVVLGRGFNYATAFEIALKLKETSHLVAEPYSFADLLHGPVAMVDQRFAVILVAPSGQALRDVSELLDLLEARGATLVTLSDRAELLARARLPLPLPVGVPEWLSPIVAVVPGQHLAGALALALGRDPDRPRGLRKVTLTR